MVTMNSPIDFLIVAAHRTQLDALLAQFVELVQISPGDGNASGCYGGEVPVTLPTGGRAAYRVVTLSFADTSSNAPTAVLSDVLRRWQPRYVVSVGHATGIAEKVAVGDIVIGEHLLRKEGGDYAMLSADTLLLGAALRLRDWQRSLRAEISETHAPRCLHGALLSPSQASVDAQALKSCLEIWPRLVGVATDVRDCLDAFFFVRPPRLLMLYGIWGLWGANTTAPAAFWRESAAQAVAVYLRALLASAPVPVSQVASVTSDSPPSPTVSELNELMFDVLPVSSDFDMFCLDNYPKIYRELGTMPRTDKHLALLSRRPLDEIFDKLRAHDLERVQKYGAKFLPRVTVTPSTSSHVPGSTGAKIPHLACFFVGEDAEGGARLRLHLASLIRSRTFTYWDPTDVNFRDAKSTQFDRQIDGADGILFLISASFLSHPSANDWMQRALDNQRRRYISIVSILYAPSLPQHSQLSALPMLPANGRPVTLWTHREEAWKGIALEIERIVSSLSGG